MNQILKRKTSCFHYGSKVPAVTITVFITILEQNRQNSCQSSTKPNKANVKNNFTSHIDKIKYFLHFCWFPYLYAFSLKGMLNMQIKNIKHLCSSKWWMRTHDVICSVLLKSISCDLLHNRQRNMLLTKCKIYNISLNFIITNKKWFEM